ncbi:HutD family protein [Myroides odoratimimus]|uniref:HutD family protein n=1 Tax=Myroides odoratimimus TaxID=76832 RepID=UPI003100DBD6
MTIELIKKEEITANVWSGGKTNEYVIYPKGAQYANKDFMFRISSATIEAVPSEFTRFKGYKRYLSMLEGDLELYRQGKEEYYTPNSLFSFGSEEEIISYSLGKDFNLMLHQSIKDEIVEISSDGVNINAVYLFIFALADNTVVVNDVCYSMQKYDCLLIVNEESNEISITLAQKAIIGYW